MTPLSWLVRIWLRYARLHTKLEQYSVSQVWLILLIALKTHSCSAILKGMFGGLRILGRSSDDWMLRSHVSEVFWYVWAGEMENDNKERDGIMSGIEGEIPQKLASPLAPSLPGRIGMRAVLVVR